MNFALIFYEFIVKRDIVLPICASETLGFCRWKESGCIIYVKNICIYKVLKTFVLEV